MDELNAEWLARVPEGREIDIIGVDWDLSEYVVRLRDGTEYVATLDQMARAANGGASVVLRERPAG